MSKLKRIESWMATVFPGVGMNDNYLLLSERELAIVAAATLDLALAELLNMRLMGTDAERDDFLGINGDGMKPVGSFGARIQLAQLTGILLPSIVGALRAIKELRNIMAHRVNVTYGHPLAKIALMKLHAALRQMAGPSPEAARSWSEIKKALEGPRGVQAAQLFVVMTLTTLQDHLALMHHKIVRLGPLW
jgi:hypothetical protein